MGNLRAFCIFLLCAFSFFLLECVQISMILSITQYITRFAVVNMQTLCKAGTELVSKVPEELCKSELQCSKCDIVE